MTAPRTHDGNVDWSRVHSKTGAPDNHASDAASQAFVDECAGEVDELAHERVNALHAADSPDLHSWSFFVPGQPVTQGNHRAFMAGGKARITEKRPAGLALWRHSISDEARKARGDAQPLTGPVSVELLFWMPRPQALPKRRRTWPIGARSGDVDKLARAAFDAMTGVLFADDSQVVHLTVRKDWDRSGMSSLWKRPDSPPIGPGVTVIVRGIA